MTLKRLIICLALLSNLGWAQTLVRYDSSIFTVSPQYTPLLQANLSPNSPTLSVCASPANAVPCTNYRTTYQANGTACPNGAQDTPIPATSSSCQPTGDSLSNIGFWAYAGTYDYTVCIQNNCLGPYTVTLGGSGGGGTVGPGTQFAFAGFNTTTTVANAPCNYSGLNVSCSGTLSITGSISSGSGSTACGTFVPCIGAASGSGAVSTTLFPYTLRFNSGGQIIPTANNVVTVTPDYQFTACDLNCPIVITGATTISPGSVTATLTPCPIGVNGTDNPHYLQLTGTTTTEYVLITGGTCTSGAASGTITFTAAYAYSANYQISSATSGIQEAWETLTPPGIVLKLMPQATYNIYAELFMPGGASTLDGQWATVNCYLNMSCIAVGGKNGGFGVTGGGLGYDVKNLIMVAGMTPWSATITGSVSGSSPTATLTLGTCPSGFYANIPNQILWLAGTSSGSPTTIFGYGEFVVTTGGGSTCAPGVSNGTVNITQATPGVTNLSAHDSGSSLSSSVSPAFEDAVSANAHFHDIKWVSPNTSSFAFGSAFMFDNDQAASIDNIDIEAGYGFRNDADFQSAAIFAPGPTGTDSAILSYGPMVNVGSTTLGSCMKWYSGNNVAVIGANICQDFSAGGFVIGNKRGGFGNFFLDGGMHFEQAGVASPWGTCLGNPAIMVVGGMSEALTNFSQTFGSGVFGTNGDSSYCIFPPTVSSQTTNQYYYLVGHNNTATGCTSGGDCTTVPVFLGEANINAPNTNNVTVSWYGWGSGGTVSAAVFPVISYDLIRVSAATSGTPPAAPQGTGNYLVASGITPASACNIHNVCSFVDNVASPTSYTISANYGGSKNYYPIVQLLPGVVAESGNGHAGNGTYSAVSGGSMNYSGAPTCINDMEYFGSPIVANFSRNSYTNEQDVGDGCPSQYATILNPGFGQSCLSSASPALCVNAKQGSVTIAAAATTITIDTTAIQPWSTISVTEDATKGTALGVTCNTTAGRTYMLTGVSYGVSATFTASAAPSTNPACLDFQIK